MLGVFEHYAFQCCFFDAQSSYRTVVMFLFDSFSFFLKTCDKLERDRLLIFLHKLTLAKDNVKEIVNEANGVPYLVDLMTLAHLHTTR